MRLQKALLIPHEAHTLYLSLTFIYNALFRGKQMSLSKIVFMHVDLYMYIYVYIYRPIYM
jgi:hypothetical protein